MTAKLNTQGDVRLTEEETRAIRSLERLAKKWPQSLYLFCSGGAISIRKPGWGNAYDIDTEVGWVSGIPNDGGDGGDRFR